MKKYLMITPWYPYPPYKNGGVHSVYNIIKNIPPQIELDLFYYYEEKADSEYIIKKYVNSIFYKNLRKTHSIKHRLTNYFQKLPDCFSELDFSGIRNAIDYYEYDVVILDQVLSLPFLKEIPKEVSIISMMHDNNILLYRRKAERDHFFKRYYDKRQCKYFYDIETAYFKRLKRVIYVSELDASMCIIMHKEFKEKIENITLGVDLPDANQISNLKTIHSMVFSGVMDYEPNEDAAIFFAKEVFPKIKEKYPDAKFVVAGRNPTETVRHIKSNDILITGFVNDMVETISKSQIYVSPLRYGSGTKNKVLEAMAAGLPVFASKVSREGIPGLQDKVNCFFTDENNMADIIINALMNEEMLKTVAQNGRIYVEENHSWKNIFSKFLID